MLSLDLTTGAAGTATLTLEFDGTRREFQVVVGSGPTPSNAPIVVATPTGVSVVPLPTMGHVSVAPGTAVSATIGVQLLGGAARHARRRSRSRRTIPSVVSLGGSATAHDEHRGGRSDRVRPAADVRNATGVAVLRFEFDGGDSDLLVSSAICRRRRFRL